MQRRHPCLAPCLALCLVAAPAAAQLPSLANYHVGSLHLDLSLANASQIELSDDHLRQVLCGESGAERGGSRTSSPPDVMPPGETCRLVISNDGSHGGNAQPETESPLQVSTALAFGPPCGVGLILVNVSPISLKGKAPIDLGSCGTWIFKAKLTPVSPAPSLLQLLPAPVGSYTGQFSGSLALRLDVSLVRVSGGEPAGYLESRELLLDVAGRWTVVQTSNPGVSSLPPGETNLALFVDRAPGADGIWSKRDGCGTVRNECTHVCLTAAGLTVSVLNGLALPPI